ncbi:MAG: addiction module protein [Halioglobus sp.]|nr:addiction module protein [Halioglobus sp.]
MSTTKIEIPQEFRDLPMRERIEYVQGLWDYIAESPQELPVPDSHKTILDERLDAFEASPDQGRPWSEVREEMLHRLRRP